MTERDVLRRWRGRAAPFSIFLGVAVCLLGFSDAAPPSPSRLPIFCTWNVSSSLGPSPPEDMGIDHITASACDYVVYSHVSLSDNGGLSFANHGHELDVIAGVQKLKRLNPSLKALLAIGGGADDADRYWSLIHHTWQWYDLERSIRLWVTENSFDGVVFDFLPLIDAKLMESSESTSGFYQLLGIIRGTRSIIGVTVPPLSYTTGHHFSIAHIALKANFLFVKSSDCLQEPQGQGLLKDTSEITALSDFDKAELLADAGVPKRKIVMEIPVYGQRYVLSDQDKSWNMAEEERKQSVLVLARNRVSASEICAKLEGGWQRRRSHFQACPYATSGSEYIAYEDALSVRRKAIDIFRKEYGAVSVSNLDSEDFAWNCSSRDRLVPKLRFIFTRRATREELTENVPIPSSGHPPTSTEHVTSHSWTWNSSTTSGRVWPDLTTHVYEKSNSNSRVPEDRPESATGNELLTTDASASSWESGSLTTSGPEVSYPTSTPDDDSHSQVPEDGPESATGNQLLTTDASASSWESGSLTTSGPEVSYPTSTPDDDSHSQVPEDGPESATRNELLTTDASAGSREPRSLTTSRPEVSYAASTPDDEKSKGKKPRGLNEARLEQQMTRRNDDFHHFGMMVAERLRKMPRLQALRAMSVVQQSLLDYEEELQTQQ